MLDFCGPFEVFATTRLNEETRRESESPIHQLLVSESTELVCTSGGMRILPDVDFASCPKLDMLLVPGGIGRSRLDASAGVPGLAQADGSARWIAWHRLAPVRCCWREAGLLVGKTATTHFRSVDFFRERYPRTSLLPELPMVVDGNITTANSIRAGIDMALYLVAQIYGQPIAREAARQMEYPYPDGQNFRSRNGK